MHGIKLQLRKVYNKKKESISNKYIKHFLVVYILAFGCAKSPEDISYFKKAQKSERQKNYTQAIFFLNKAIDTSENPQLLLQAAKQGLYILKYSIKNELEDKLKGHSKNRLQIRYLRLILIYSQDEVERLSSQKSIADIYFNTIKDYHKAIEELSRLFTFNLSKSQILEIRLKISKSYYHIGKLQQARIELEKIEKNSKPSFEVLLLKGNILLGEEKLDQSALVYENLIEKFPKKSITNKVFLTLSLCYEEQKKFQKAIDLLSKFLKDHTSSLDISDRNFISMKIQRLKETHKMQPGILQPGQKYRR